MRHLLFVLVIFTFWGTSNAQISINANQVDTFSKAGQGDLYLDSDNVFYIGLQDGSLQLLSDFKPKNISNELLFQDATYYYVSMKVSTNDYLVVRYNKTDVNAEKRAIGTAAQPSDLAAVQALTYN